MKEDASKLLYKVLRDNNYSVTKARKLVFDLLWDHEPQSMHDLVTGADSRIDRASLYRIIGLFEKLGVAQRLYIGWKHKVELSDIFSHHHHHIACMGCGKLIAIREDNEIEQLIHSLAKRNRMTAERHQLEIQGYCETCLATRATPVTKRNRSRKLAGF